MASRHLLVLDLNGILCGRVFLKPGAAPPGKPSAMMGALAVYTRPHPHEFVKFLQEHFVLAVWILARRHNVLPLVGHLFGEDIHQ
jgi:hypothetical protein